MSFTFDGPLLPLCPETPTAGALRLPTVVAVPSAPTEQGDRC